ncbi:MAG: hypothetical protein WC662_02185 [Candidatus Paceibacterota bacterium]|jgi:hypothetical protein
MENQNIWRGTDFWTKEIKKAGVESRLLHFNDVIIEKTPPHPESGYHLVLSDVLLDGKHCDIYHSDQDENGDKIRNKTYHRLFLQIKE